MLSAHADNSNSQKREQQNFLSRVGRRLYEVTLAPVSTAINYNDILYLLRFSRIADKNGQIYRQLDQAGLTRRELEIAALIHQGISTRNISDQLNLSYHTVRNHIKHIYCKINVSTRSEMLAWGG
jgi:DNA-binding CsgD family transcriptional regulator